MKFCQRCGTKLDDDADFCTSCGSKLGESAAETKREERVQMSGEQADTLGLIAFIFMIIGTVCMGFALFPLIWCIPMTIYLNNKLKNGEPIGVGFKICTLLFVSLVAGILLLCKPERE